ncbi:hypothetical protein KM914_19025 [Virgibacillus pantothenticus]|uniref:hypothetical protein n=1 Tax=Virgibacillus pantothenticus TaxID=1473 RepID=UPI001C229854|nr:hypothetical protein [Virgibacillus pantothenticus]MBU8568475.1 hypothetical protein [Virgibacillus pantothenticus]MBU8636651.1 hypothetical protein [Virgibacillus pantothenticus]MBU8642201.1 hypothetical protein [Virgibacillus pantothenticus]MBU8646361.1 hypothetical protein [Virgibacillus pantothenticus]MBU8659911.1 hypothetical protein [Virgibacillus pantothenticus]
MKARLSEEESGLFTSDQSFLWKLALENLDMQLNDTSMNSDSSGNNELIQMSILNDWKEMKGKLTVIQDEYEKFSETIDMWIHLKKLIGQLNIENHQIVPWIIRQKRGSRLLGLTKRVLLWQEIEDFIQSMDRLQLLLNSTPEQLTEK